MLAMYNLKVGGIYNINTSTYTPYTESEMTYLQDEDMKGYVDTYKTILEGMGANVIDASLITKEELEQLVNDGNNLSSGSIKTLADELNRSWVYSASYWSGSAKTSGSLAKVYKVWYVHSNGDFKNGDYGLGYEFGVRPVITIARADL